jgi:hypothetical protein
MKIFVEKTDLEFPIDPTFDPPKPTLTLDQYADFVRRFGGRSAYDRNKDIERCLVPFELK